MKLIPTKFHWGVLLGNICDHYDTALYGFLAPFIAHQFFPTDDPLTALILAYALQPSSLITRPLGSIFFGMIGDFYGGRTAFTCSLVGVALTTTLIAFLPTYAQIGYLAPIFLALIKMLQSFFSAGELSSSGVLLMANTPSEQKNMMSGLYNASSMGGILLASSAVMLLGMYGTPQEGWRILYLLGSLTLVFVYLLRKSASFTLPPKTPKKTKDLLFDLWTYKKELFTIAVIYGFSFSCYSVAFALVNAILPYVTTLSKVDVSKINSFFMAIDCAMLPLFAWIGNFISYRKMLLSGAILAMVSGIPLFALLEGADLQCVLIVRFFLMAIGVSFSATVLPWSQKLLPKPVRFTGTGIAFALGSQLIGTPTTAISLWIYQKTQIASSIGWYWVAIASVSLGLILWSGSRVSAEEPQPAIE